MPAKACRRGRRFGLTNTSRQIGGSIGLAVVSSIAATASSHYAHSHALPAFSSRALTHGFHVAFHTRLLEGPSSRAALRIRRL